jgi:hypothetical protein
MEGKFMNTAPPASDLPAIFLAEDDVPVATNLRKLLNFRLPGSGDRLVHATSVEAGRTELERFRFTGQPLDLVVLDFKLPMKTGENEESDFSLAMAVREWFPKAFIVQMTAHGTDPEIQRFVQSWGTAHNPEAYCFVPKLDCPMPHLADIIVRAAHTRRVRQTFEELFPRERREGGGLAGSRRRSVGRCNQDRRLAIATLCDDAGRHWLWLAPTLQADLSEILGHAEDPRGHHIVGIVPAAGESDDANEEIEL